MNFGPCDADQGWGRGLDMDLPGGAFATNASGSEPAVAEPVRVIKPRIQPRYHVILLNDDDHTYRYVIEMMMVVFSHPPEKGFLIAKEVDRTGRAICLTTTLEHAELKQQQVHAYGPDPYFGKDCKGSMTAILEPAE